MVLDTKTFRTEVSIRPLSHAPLLRHQEPLLLLGSCFSEGVGGRLQAAGHDALANPLGTMFSPASIRRATELLADGPAASWDPPRLDERSGLWYTFDAGATITHPTRTGCEAAVADALAAGHSQLRRSSCLFVTLGSAWSPQSKTHAAGPPSPWLEAPEGAGLPFRVRCPSECLCGDPSRCHRLAEASGSAQVGLRARGARRGQLPQAAARPLVENTAPCRWNRVSARRLSCDPSGACVGKAATHGSRLWSGPALPPLPATRTRDPLWWLPRRATCTSRRAQFERALCGVSDCAEELRRCVHAARSVGGEGMRVVLTVSPVRRWHKSLKAWPDARSLSPEPPPEAEAEARVSDEP